MLSVRAVLICCCVSMAMAQIPSLGWCPEYAPMPDFDMSKYLGVWYESERYFTVLEVASRCVTTNYTQGLDGKFHVSNQITNRLTGIKRIVDGELRSVGKAGEGKLTVKYSTLPAVSFDTTFSVLDTDYETYSVMWSCSGLGPVVNTQNAWVMTRERLAPGTVLQRAYGVLDKFKISRTFFVKTDQADCAILEASSNNDPLVSNEEELEELEEEEDNADVRSNVPAAVPLMTPSEAMVPPAPLLAAVPDAVKAEPIAPEQPVGAPIVEVVLPSLDAVKAEETEAVKPEIVEPVVPKVSSKVQVAKSQTRKKVQDATNA